MKVKGVAFLARKIEIEKMFNENRWQAFLEDLQKKHHYFKQPVYQTSRIPLEEFLAFQEMAIREFFNDNTKSYWELGKNSAKWSFTEGPFKSVLDEEDFGRFLGWGTPSIWKSYYDFGSAKAWLEGEGTVYAQLLDLPVIHPHFEFGSMGFIEGVIELFTKKSSTHENVTPKDATSMIEYVFHY